MLNGNTKEKLTHKLFQEFKGLSEAEIAEFVTEFALKIDVKTEKPKKKLPPNIMVFQTIAYLCATKLKPASNKILMYFFALSEYENVISMDQQQIMEDLGLKRTAVYEALKELQEHGVIVIAPYVNDKRRREYMLNPVGSWKGNSTSRHMLLNKMMGGDTNQMSLFGESIGEALMREAGEIKTKGKSFNAKIEALKEKGGAMKPNDNPLIEDIDYGED
jgi:predicted transcriptional regulator